MRVGHALAKKYEWTGKQWKALLELYACESSWRHEASNPSSQACGIPQSWPCAKLAKAVPDYKHNVRGQLRWGYDYIKGRYGTPLNALKWHYKHNWY